MKLVLNPSLLSSPDFSRLPRPPEKAFPKFLPEATPARTRGFFAGSPASIPEELNHGGTEDAESQRKALRDLRVSVVNSLFVRLHDLAVSLDGEFKA